MNKYMCIYAYYEKNDIYKENLNFFFNNGGILDYVDYYIVINGNYTITIPEKINIKVIQRENKGYDFGAWSMILNNYINKKYDYYIFINGSVRGPYISPYSINNWLDKFMELFNNKDTKMVGSTINIYDNAQSTHIQSIFFILDNDALLYLKKLNFFNEEELNNINDMWVLIDNYEIKLSQLILKNGWNINCIIPYYRDLDYRLVKHDINFSSNNGDVLYDNAFFGRTLIPKDVIFYKYYRFINEGHNNEGFNNIGHNNEKYNNNYQYYIIILFIIIISYYLSHSH
jgi:hypothetical protein